MCFGPFKRICHWGPLTALVFSYYKNSYWHDYALCKYVVAKEQFWRIFNTALFISLSGLTLYNFLSSMYHGPGYLPPGWKPVNEDDCKFLQLCGVCRGYKAPRSHHCRKCGRCILKMDHHCPWINNCVGWGNHAHFTMFLAFATLGCFHATIVLGCSLYQSIHRAHYIYYGINSEPVVHLGLYGIVMCVLALGFAIGVVAAVGMLLYFQFRAIIRNRTGIEDWILEKANFRRRNSDVKFVFPYDLGPWKNFCQVINYSCHPVGDGINWPVVRSCDQYTLTREQLVQKNEKRLKTRKYSIIRPASGAWFPITQGLKVCLNFPCTDEPRIKLNVGDAVWVTRWRKHWLFGEKIQPDLPEGEEALHRTRGWFPRKCAVELIENDGEGPDLLKSRPRIVTDKKIK